MMGPVGKREVWLAGILGVLAINLVIGWHFYDVGKRNVALKSTRDSLAVVVSQKKVIQHQRDSIGAVLVIADKKSAETRTVYLDTKTRIKGDSVFDKKGQFIQVVDHRIIQSLAAAADHITNLEQQLRDQKFALRVDTVFIAKQDEETGLNQRIAQMVEGSRFSHGLQVGAGGCLGGDGIRRACIYIGYGVEVKL